MFLVPDADNVICKSRCLQLPYIKLRTLDMPIIAYALGLDEPYSTNRRVNMLLGLLGVDLPL